MNGISFTVKALGVYTFIALLQSGIIIFHFLASAYYGIRMIIIKTENRYGWCPEMLVTFESILWFGLFGYIFISTITGNSLIDNTSFGAVFIRPLILITSVITATLQKRRYIRAYNKFVVENIKNEK